MEKQLLDQFLETLRGLPEVQAELGSLIQPGGPDRGYDARVDLRAGGKSATLMVEVKKILYPRDVRQVLWRFQEFAQGWPQSAEERQTLFFLVAQSISPGAKELLRDKRVGYYDIGGSLFLPARDIYIYVDKPLPKTLSKTIRSLFSGRRAQVLHVLLMRYGEWFGVKEIAEQAQVSPATASQVLTELERFDWVASRGQGPTKERDLREPGALLDAWVERLAVMRSPAMRRYFVPSVRSEDLVRKFAEVFAAQKAEYALTHEAAGQRYAPFLSTVSQVRCRVMAGAAADRALDTLDAHIVDRGANLVIIEVKSSGELLFRELVDGAWLASPVQVYLDLICGEGRSREMAKHLRQERIGF
ncbi:MAG: hypothetical protein OXL41_14965 [Nitrospinae bacterium]|nr:hypothetical protein [Nitrospinota bacterium]